MSRFLWSPLTLFAAIFAIMALRSTEAILFPVLAYEDGRDMFPVHFHTTDPSSVFRFYAGYVFLIPNLIGYVATRFPVTVAPHLFTLASLALASGGIFLLSRNAHAWLIADPRARAVVALLIALLPLGKSHLITNLSFSVWNCLFLLLVLMTRRLPRSAAGLTGFTLAACLCALSHPLSLIVLPICGVQFFIHRHWMQRVSMVVCVGAILGYQAFGVDHGYPMDVSLSSVRFALRAFLARVSFETVFGAHAATLLAANGGDWIVYGFGALLLGVTTGMALAGRTPLRDTPVVLGAVALGFALALSSIMVRCIGEDARLFFLRQPYLQRYFYVPKLMLAALMLAQVVPRLMTRAAAMRPLAKCAFLGTGLLYLGIVNVDNRGLYGDPKEEGLKTARFLGSVAADLQRARSGGAYVAEHTLVRDQLWNIELNIDRHLGRAASSGRTGGAGGK